MREIEIVGPADDDRFLLARDRASAEMFHVVADRRLRSLYHTDARSAASQERPMNPLSPREIQSRIRSGASPEDLAAQFDMPLDKISGFALPVLAEREHVAGQARAAPVRRRYTDGTVTLQDALRAQLTEGRLEDATWDAWRREDGRWTITVVFEHGEPADFVFDTHGRYVIADSVHASTLIGDTNDASPDMALAQALVDADASAEVVEPLSSTESIDDRTEARGSDFEPDPLFDPEVEAASYLEAFDEAVPWADLLEDSSPLAESVSLSDLFDDDPPEGVASLKRARDRRAMGQLALGDLEGYGFDPPSEASRPEPVASEPTSSVPEPPVPEVPVPEVPVSEAPVPETSGPKIAQATEDDHDDVEPAEPIGRAEPKHRDTEAVEPLAAEGQPPPKKRERRRVPSWDEIMFGNSTS